MKGNVQIKLQQHIVVLTMATFLLFSLWEFGIALLGNKMNIDKSFRRKGSPVIAYIHPILIICCNQLIEIEFFHAASSRVLQQNVTWWNHSIIIRESLRVWRTCSFICDENENSINDAIFIIVMEQMFIVHTWLNLQEIAKKKEFTKKKEKLFWLIKIHPRQISFLITFFPSDNNFWWFALCCMKNTAEKCENGESNWKHMRARRSINPASKCTFEFIIHSFIRCAMCMNRISKYWSFGSVCIDEASNVIFTLHSIDKNETTCCARFVQCRPNVI